ncbi:hypothetical protein KIN20_001411 [Parelaphostrongylus tenuis]|uniref:Transmembrane protein n=1 Tax=Parelaphostrongylus tenuis TaxID=148309 RepID=A0AAD5QG77_PARTN|nr:hypothetical protein KIN20_001411 [Parelaphostrongylus tenuis]
MTFDLKKATSLIGRQIAGESPPEPIDSSTSSGYVTMEQSPDDVSNRFFSSLLYDVLQVLVTLWVIILSYLWSYVWRQHNKKFFFSVCFVVPAVLSFGFMLSGILTTLVVCGKFYSIFANFKEKLMCLVNGESPGGSLLDRKHRSGSSTSVVSVISEEYFVAPSLCRQHSLSTNSLPTRPPSDVCRHTYHGASAFPHTTISGPGSGSVSGHALTSAPDSTSATSLASAPSCLPFGG